MDLSEPLVSVVVPAFNAEAWLAEAIESVLAQSYPRVELVVVDDGSTDATGKIIRGYGERIRCVSQANAGLASARNAGLAVASGAFIALFDADDVCMPERLATQVAYLLENPDVGLCSSEFSAFDESGEIAPTFLSQYYGRVERDGGIVAMYDRVGELDLPGPAGTPMPTKVRTMSGWIHDRLVWGNYVHPPTIMFRSKLLARVGNFSLDLRNLCDYEWLLRVSRVSRIGFIDRPLIRYRVSPGQMSGDRNTAAIKLDTVDIMQSIARIDPGFYRTNEAALRRRVGAAYRGAADALVDTDKPGALRHLVRSLRDQAPDLAMIKILVKLLLPRRVLAAIRARRANRQQGPGNR